MVVDDDVKTKFAQGLLMMGWESTIAHG